jgi:hypothetical protein
MTNPKARDVMLRVAQEYEDLARRTQVIGGSTFAAAPSSPPAIIGLPSTKKSN